MERDGENFSNFVNLHLILARMEHARGFYRKIGLVYCLRRFYLGDNGLRGSSMVLALIFLNLELLKATFHCDNGL